MMNQEQLLHRILSYCHFDDKHPIYRSFLSVPRNRFVEDEDRDFAYDDRPLPIGEGQTISQPTMIFSMLDKLQCSQESRVLEIGTGSGYHTALLTHLCKEIYTVERNSALLSCAKQRLDKMGLKNIQFKLGDGTLGWKEKAPYDRIIVTAGAPYVPDNLKAQLKIGGILVIPVGDEFRQQVFRIKRKSETIYEKKTYEGCVFVKLIGLDGWGEE